MNNDKNIINKGNNIVEEKDSGFNIHKDNEQK